MSLFHIHKWLPWSEQYEVEHSYGEFGVHCQLTQRSIAQQRVCAICGKVDQRIIGQAKRKEMRP